MPRRKFHDDEITMAFRAAKQAGTIAANRQAAVLASRFTPTTVLLDLCGGTFLRLHVDVRTSLGRQLLNFRHADIKVSREHGLGLVVSIRYPFEDFGIVNGQEVSIYIAADTAAAAVLRSRLGIKATVTPFID